MSHHLKTILAATALAMLPSVSALAQDVSFDLTKPSSVTGDKGTSTNGVVTATYVLDYKTNGALIQGGWAQGIYFLDITSSQPIAVIELEGQPSSSSTNLFCNTGTLHMRPSEVSLWQGSATAIQIKGKEKEDQYVFTKMRVWYVGTPYGKQYVADPTITVGDGRVSFASETPGTTFTYSLMLTADGKTRMSTGSASVDGPLVVTVHGEATDHEASAPVTTKVPLVGLYGKQGDANGNGRIDLDDLEVIINELLKTTAK